MFFTYIIKHKALYPGIKHIKSISRQLRNIWVTYPNNDIDRKLMIKIFLLISEINQNTYCKNMYEKKAIKNYISPLEIELLKKGIPGEKNSYDSLALLYALHWATKNGMPESDFRNEVINHYNTKMVQNIEALVNFISIKNKILTHLKIPFAIHANTAKRYIQHTEAEDHQKKII